MNDADYKKLLLQLQPQGLAWNKDEGSNLNKLVGGEAKEFARVEAAAVKTLRELNPLTTTELIEEWAAIALGDDDCVKNLTTPEQKRLAVMAKLQALGGSDKIYFQNVAKAAGFLVSVSDGFQQFRAGSSRSGDRVLGDGFAYTWEVRSPSETLRYFRAGSGRAGDPIVYFGNAFLECLLESIKPFHTEIIFRYQDIIQQLAGACNINVSMAGDPTVIRRLAGSIDIGVIAELAESWNPGYLTNLLLWYDGEEFSSDADIDTWTDKVGNRNALQPDTGTQPESVTNAMNGRTVVRFETGDQLQVKSMEEFNANNGLHFFAVCNLTAGGGLLFDRNQLYLTADTSHIEAEVLTTSYRANNVIHNTLPAGNPGSGGVMIYDGDLFITGSFFGMYRLESDGSWTNVLSSLTNAAPRGRMAVVGTKLYAISSTVNKMYVWDGTTAAEYVNTVNASADLSDLVYNPGDSLIYVADRHNHKLLAFNPADNTWSEKGTGATGADSVATDGTNVYINKRAGGTSGDILKWNGSSLTSESLTGVGNPTALAWIQGTLWFYDTTTGKITNKANSYTLTGVPEFLYLNPNQMFELENQIWFVSDGNYFGGAIARLNLDGTNLDPDAWVLNQYGSQDLIDCDVGSGDYNHNLVFIPGTDNKEVYYNAGNKVQRIERKRFVTETDTIPAQSIIYFGLENNNLQISINGELVQDVAFVTETYRDPNILLEQIAITNTGLVSFVDDIVTINPTSNLPENAVIEVEIDSDAITDWAGIDDWTFETGV